MALRERSRLPEVPALDQVTLAALLPGLLLIAVVSAVYGFRVVPTVRGLVERRPAPSTSAVTTALIMATDVGCGPRELRMAGPGELRVTFHNHGQFDHALTIAGLAGQVAAEPDGGSATGTFTIVHPGTYTFWCGAPGQRVAAMKGELLVGNGPAAGR